MGADIRDSIVSPYFLQPNALKFLTRNRPIRAKSQTYSSLKERPHSVKKRQRRRSNNQIRLINKTRCVLLANWNHHPRELNRIHSPNKVFRTLRIRTSDRLLMWRYSHRNPESIQRLLGSWRSGGEYLVAVRTGDRCFVCSVVIHIAIATMNPLQ